VDEFMIPVVGGRQRIYEENLETMEVCKSTFFSFFTIKVQVQREPAVKKLKTCNLSIPMYILGQHFNLLLGILMVKNPNLAVFIK